MAKTKKTMDGAMAAAFAGYAFTEVAGIYPITPSTTLAEYTDEWAAQGKTNMFGQTVDVIEMQSEAGAAGTMHGSLQAGALTASYTASQGLLLMIPNMYKMAGELLPGVLHVTARTVASHALSIYGDHSDVMACRQTGFALLASNSVQEAMDLGAVAHLAAIKGRVPFLHFFDGFRTSAEMQKIDVLDYDELRGLVDMEALNEFRKNALNPASPVTRGTAQGGDIFFQAREASNPYYNNLPAIVEDCMNGINKLTGRDYRLFNYYGHPEAEHIIIGMGSMADTAEEAIDHLIAKGEKVGMLKVRLYRPFSIEHFLKEIPSTVKRIAVLDRTKEPGAIAEPLHHDVRTAYFDMAERPLIVGGRYGLSSKDVTPAQIVAVFENLKQPEPKNNFTVGINDDVTHLSLPVGEAIDTAGKDTISAKFWGIGSDGTIGANKNSIKIIGDTTDLEVQAYFWYDSKKSGGITQSHLRFGKDKIRSSYLVSIADVVAVHKTNFVQKYDVLTGLKKNGTFLLNTNWDLAGLEENLPGSVKRYLANNNISFYTVDATGIAQEIGLGQRINTVLQSAFFKVSKVIPMEDAKKEMKAAIEATYSKRGQKVLEMNYEAVDRGENALVKVEIPAAWANAPLEEVQDRNELPDYYKKVNLPMETLKGDDLPVSTFVGREDGTFDNGSSAFEKRAIGDNIPVWVQENCIQCNFCSYVCPHATIRPVLTTDEELGRAPENFTALKAVGKGMDGLNFTISVNPLDCVGCGVCVAVCPGKGGNKALYMNPQAEEAPKYPAWEFGQNLPKKENPFGINTVKGSQFETPLLQYSGACAGCGETPYAKLITQLYGDAMVIANATGCSSIWGASAPSTPYAKNEEGRGPAWANSLFEDTAEFGLGMMLGDKKLKEGLIFKAERLLELGVSAEVSEAIKLWIETISSTLKSKVAARDLIAVLEGASFTGEAEELRKDLLLRKDNLAKISNWIFGGDGWAYDIGFGGLDHAIATGEDINIFVFDTEIYSNTGGQSSKASQTGSIAKLAAAGKATGKKDLGAMAITYGNVYVAQIAMGSDYNQTLKAIAEAEAYPGPSVVIAYAPCISHGIKGGMSQMMQQMKDAVVSGYWHLYRYNPQLIAEGKNPFILDSKEPKLDGLESFLDSESRYSALKRFFPERAEELYQASAAHAQARYERYKVLAEAK